MFTSTIRSFFLSYNNQKSRQIKAFGVQLLHKVSIHYSGNFYSASCNSIKDLPITTRAFPKEIHWFRLKNYILAETWIFNYTNNTITSKTTSITNNGDDGIIDHHDYSFIYLFQLQGNLHDSKAAELS